MIPAERCRGTGSCSENRTARCPPRPRGIKIYAIPIEDNLQLNWDVGFCSNDYAYLKYGRYEELILSTDPDNEYITYEELYREEGRGGR